LVDCFGEMRDCGAVANIDKRFDLVSRCADLMVIDEACGCICVVSLQRSPDTLDFCSNIAEDFRSNILDFCSNIAEDFRSNILDFRSNLLCHVLHRLNNAVAVGKSRQIVETLHLHRNPAKVARELGHVGLLTQHALGHCCWKVDSQKGKFKRERG